MLPVEVFPRCADFCNDESFCALRGSSSQALAATSQEKEQRTRYAFTLTLRGRAEMQIDAKQAMNRSRKRGVKRFVAAAHYNTLDAGLAPLGDQVVTVTFRTLRRENIDLMHDAVRQFLRSLRTIPDGHILCESIKFAYEFDGCRDSDLDWVAFRLPEQTTAVPRG